jgi:hypothetical protein
VVDRVLDVSEEDVCKGLKRALAIVAAGGRKVLLSSVLHYLRQRLLSAEDRFFRLVLKTARPGSRGVQLAPPNSLAFRTEVKSKEWRFAGLPLGQLCRDFFDGRKPGFVPKASREKSGPGG